MGSNSSPSSSTPVKLDPKRSTLLGDLIFNPDTIEPLGGLNPYSHHFDNIGKQFRQLCIEHAKLQKTHKILDIGCGTGRLAKPLLEFIDGGSYDGFDVNKRFIDYCVDNYDNCTFKHCDVKHDEYNPSGNLNPLTFEFPYPDKSFDIVTCIAVFNHFHTQWVSQYIRQISRVLKPKGILFSTILLLNQQSMGFIEKNDNQPYLFPSKTINGWFDFENRPLFNVAHPEIAIRRTCIKSGMMIKEPIRYGEWCLSKIALAGPDILIAAKGAL